MIAQAWSGQHHDTRAEDPRISALSAAVAFRDCSQKPHTSLPTSRVCRGLMRRQALKWRQLGAVPPSSHTT